MVKRSQELKSFTQTSDDPLKQVQALLQGRQESGLREFLMSRVQEQVNGFS